MRGDAIPNYNGALPNSQEPVVVVLAQGPKQPSNCYPITANEAKRQIKALSNAIFTARDKVQNILKNREVILRRRWAKRSKEQRAKVLRAAWPDIPNNHRPDIQELLDTVNPTKTQSSKTLRTDAIYKWPHLSVEDLAHSKTLLLLLNSRGHNSPDVFAHADLESCRLGTVNDKIKTAWLPKYAMVIMGQETPKTYGTLVRLEEEPEAFLLWNAGVHFNVAEGLLILEIQSKLYDFLLHCCLQLFSDVPPNDLISIHVVQQPEPEPLESNAASYLDLSSVVAEAPFRVPNTLDTCRLLQLIESKRAAAEDHVWAIQEDPGYFREALVMRARHRKEHLRDEEGNTSPDLDSQDFWNTVILREVDAAFQGLLQWDSLYEHAKALHYKVPNGFETFDHSQPLPEDVDSIILNMLLLTNSFSIAHKYDLSGAIPASEEMGIHCIRLPDYEGTTVTCIGQTPKSDRLMRLFDYMFDADDTALCQVGLDNLVNEVQRLIENNPKQSRRLSPFVSDLFLDLAFVANISRVLVGIFPWAASFERKMNQLVATPPRHSQTMLSKRIYSTLPNVKTKNGVAAEALLPLPIRTSLNYPIHRAYNEHNVDTLRHSEWNLDRFWRGLDCLFYKSMGETLNDILCRCSKVSRVIHRTLPYRPPEPRSKTPVVLANPTITNFAPEAEDPTPSSTQKPRTKIKTRGVISTTLGGADTIVDGVDALATKVTEKEAKATFKLKDRALDVFRNMFHLEGSSSHQQGEIHWKDFLHAMTKIGFAAEKLYGSIWHFTRVESGVSGSFQVHEPHPEKKIPYVMARDIGRRLTHRYGWTASDFVEA